MAFEQILSDDILALTETNAVGPLPRQTVDEMSSLRVGEEPEKLPEQLEVMLYKPLWKWLSMC